MDLSKMFSFKKKYNDNAINLYAKIIAQARNESFYISYGVPDTVNGRFGLITLHMFIVLRRLKELGSEGSSLSQDLFDTMFSDMDQNLREMGVGDLSVGKKVKALAAAFFGRIKAYDEGIIYKDRKMLINCLKRNLFSDAHPRDEDLELLTKYFIRQMKGSQSWSISDLRTSNIFFEPIEKRQAYEKSSN